MAADPPQSPEQQPPSVQETKPAPAKSSGPSQGRPRPQQSASPQSGQRPQGQRRPPQRDPSVPKYGQSTNRASEYAMMPFVFFSFMFGLVNMGAVPVIYVYEILKNNEKDQWPAWSGLDGLNYLFFSKNPLFVRNDLLYHIGAQNLPVLALDLHIAAVTKFINSFAVTYLGMAVAFVCFLQGVIFLWLSVRIAIRALDKPKPEKSK